MGIRGNMVENINVCIKIERQNIYIRIYNLVAFFIQNITF